MKNLPDIGWALLLLGIVGGVAWCSQQNPKWPMQTRGPESRARDHLATIETAISMYRLTNRGDVPPDLETLTHPDPDTGEPYLRRIPLDPWGNAYFYEPAGKREFDLRSAGPDGVPRSEDDILFDPEC